MSLTSPLDKAEQAIYSSRPLIIQVHFLQALILMVRSLVVIV